MATDTSGNQKVDFVWGNFPMQPNDDRTDGTPVVVVANNATQNKQWSGYSTYPSARLNAALDNHANAEAGWAGYPAFIATAANYIVTEASGNGTTVTYVSQNKLQPGDVVNITGLTASAYNLSSATVASATAYRFTVTNSANAGLVTGQYGKVESATALADADGAGIGYIVVPNVLGTTTAFALDALKDAGYEAASITTASAATNSAKTIVDLARTSGTTSLKVTTSASHGYVAGNKITLTQTYSETGLSDSSGTYTVVSVPSATEFTVTTTATSGVSVTDTDLGSVVAVSGTIKSQSTAGGAASVATTATITITPWA